MRGAAIRHLVAGAALLPVALLAATGGPSLSFRCRMSGMIEHELCCPTPEKKEAPVHATLVDEACCETLLGDTLPDPSDRATRTAIPVAPAAIIDISTAVAVAPPPPSAAEPWTLEHPPPRPPPLEFKRALLI